MSTFPLFSSVAVLAVQRWRFDPAKDENGKPVAVQVNVEVNFRMSD